MDKSEKISNVIKSIHDYQDKKIADFQLITVVCDFFDYIKDKPLVEADLKFLHHIACSVGIPHYFDLLEKFGKKTEFSEIDLSNFASSLYESTLHTSLETKLHKYQKKILDEFVVGQTNKYFLSASTSFGKTHIIYEVIKKMNYKNVVLIFPSVALLAENLEKILSEPKFKVIKEKYSVHTLSDVKELGENNIFIYTPERFLSYMEKSRKHIDFDFVFIDEIYKIDNTSIVVEETEVSEDERDVSYRIAAYYALMDKSDILLAGPYIEGFSLSFKRFLKEYQFKELNYNSYEIVNKTIHDIKGAKSYQIDNVLTVDFSASKKTERLREIVSAIVHAGESVIVFCRTQTLAERYAKGILGEESVYSKTIANYSDFTSHIEREFRPDWGVAGALKKGVGVHHASIPKYIQKEIIKLFNDGDIRVLFSTTTITEGVNTSAKNLIVTTTMKGDQPLKRFDAKNIAGRAGRFLQHYKGRVIIYDNGFKNILTQGVDEISHKNFDINSQKSEVDLFYTDDEFLTDDDKAKRNEVEAKQALRDIPEDIFGMYKIVSRSDKILLYDRLKALSGADFQKLRQLVGVVHSDLNIHWDGFQILIDSVLPIVRNATVQSLIKTKANKGESKFSLLTVCVAKYLEHGLKGMIDYHLSQGKKIDEAVKISTKFVFNTLRYQTVKYIGVFNVMFKLIISEKEKVSWEEVPALDRLLAKLEYNALTDKGKLVSDYGVPANVLRYYENEMRPDIRSRFDSYEESIFNRTVKITEKA